MARLATGQQQSQGLNRSAVNDATQLSWKRKTSHRTSELVFYHLGPYLDAGIWLRLPTHRHQTLVRIAQALVVTLELTDGIRVRVVLRLKQ